MKKKNNKLMIGAMIASGSIFTACNINGNVYGPPPSEEVQTVIPEPVYGPPASFAPENNIPEDVYGPPMEEWDIEEVTETPEPGKPQPSFEEAENVPVCVYGPPEYFEKQNAQPEK